MTVGGSRVVVLDRDGVINVDVPGKYVCSADDWVAIAGSLEAMGRLTEAGFDIYVVSNQSGIGRGLFTEDDLSAIQSKLVDELARHGGQLAGWFYCPHTPAQHCDCRKPETGLLRKVADAAGCDLSGAPFIGDKISDLRAANRMTMRGILVGTGHGRLALRDHSGEVGEFFPDLARAVDALTDGAVP